MQENENIQPVLELGMEELEAMEAPFWGQFLGGLEAYGVTAGLTSMGAIGAVMLAT